MKQKLLISLLCLAFVLPVYMAGAQEDEQETAYEPAQQSVQETAPESAGDGAVQAPVKKPASQGRQTQGADSISVWINRIIAYVSQIGNMFGKTLGFRIGGTTGTAIVTLVIARLLQDRAPSWIRWVLYLTGGTMVAGSGANITQVVMNLLGG